MIDHIEKISAKLARNIGIVSSIAYLLSELIYLLAFITSR